MNNKQIKIIAFDADDTLWDNEHYFREAEDRFCQLLEDYLPVHSINRELLKIEIANMPAYGFGIKAFMLSMIETAITVSGGKISNDVINRIIDIGKDMLNKPVEIIDGVEEVLQKLKGRYRLVMATKGDLRDQEKKLEKSGLEHYFHHTEVMSEKNDRDYQKLIRHLDIDPEQFIMIGNSIKSDILPVVELGGNAIHVPYHLTWEYEKVEDTSEDQRFYSAETISEVPEFIRKIENER